MLDRHLHLARLIHWLDSALKFLAVLVLGLLLLCVMLGVATRALGDPLIWSDEVARFLMVWLAVLGWLLASRQRVHIRIRFFIDQLPTALRRPIELAIQLAIVVFGGLIVWHGRDLVSRNFDVEATTVPLPMSFIYLPIVLAGLVTAAQALGEAWEILRGAPPTAALRCGPIE